MGTVLIVASVISADADTRFERAEIYFATI